MAIKWSDIDGATFENAIYNVASSGNGKMLGYAVSAGAGINAFSYDYGVTWSYEGCGAYVAYPRICIDFAGEVAIVGWGYTGSQGSIWLYKDGSWTETLVGDHMASLAVSGDGNYLVVGYRNGDLAVSPDTGDNWAVKATVPSKSWGCGAANYSGQYMLAGQQSARLYLSTDYGENWSEVQPAGNADKTWRTANINSDGDKMLVSNEQRLYLSTNYGSTWSEIRPLGDVDKNWRVDFDDTGQIIIAGVRTTGRLYLSLDGGTTWAEERPAGDVDANWDVSMNDAGTRFFVGQIGVKGFIGSYRSGIRHYLPLMGAG
jgi:photosystem II stability/assembly factor-like uncharacterized protein